MKKWAFLSIIIVSLIFISACKRSEYTAPEFTGPAVKDLYALINVGKTVLPVGENTSVMVKVISNLGAVKGAKVNIILTNYDGSGFSRYGSVNPSSGVTDENGIFRTTLYAPDSLFGLYTLKVVAHISGDPYLFNNRILTAQAVVIISGR